MFANLFNNKTTFIRNEIGAWDDKSANSILSDPLVSEYKRYLEEIRRRKRIYYGGHQAISANGKIAILVDDGIATGYTMEVAIKEIKLQNPQKIVVAVPIVSPDVARRIEEEVDELIALDISLDFLGSVGAYYMNFPQVEDEEVIELLKK